MTPRRYVPCRAATFRCFLAVARDRRPEIRDATSAPAELPDGGRYYVAADGLSGFGVADGGELVGVFSIPRGRGAELVTAAIARGAARLDCFDGYLPRFYAQHGFTETGREPNWEPDGPDVVYMERKA